MNDKIPRILIAGTSSGCGKTTVTCAILQMLVNRTIETASFKCGPDYIDPMFHAKIIGVNSSNLDSYFCDNNTLNYLFAKNSKNCDIAVVEGVMGFYDGSSMNSSNDSAYDLAKKIGAPVILTVNCRGMAHSIVAILKGFVEFRKDNNIVGVILNNITSITYDSVKIAIEEEWNGRIKVLGYLPVLPQELIFESRYLGLITASEISKIKEKMKQLASIVEKTIDMDGIMECAHHVNDMVYVPIEVERFDKKIRIAVAMDNAFCFYYRDNLELLEELGAELVYFSPIKDKNLPEDICGIYFGGGYPELYVEQLSSNVTMLESIRKVLMSEIPCIAECGGFMYLSEMINGYRMVGYLNGSARKPDKRTRFGYVTLEAQKDTLLCCKGERIRGHEFHYYDSTDNGDAFIAEKTSGKTWECVVSNEWLYAGYPHIHFYSNIESAKRFYAKCVERKKNHG